MANEVAQTSKIRNKNDFLLAFSPVIAEATATAYKGASDDVQQKLKRVVEVWRQRSIFELAIQEAVEARVNGNLSNYQWSWYIADLSAEVDKTRGSGKKGLEGGGIFSRNAAATPSELIPLVAPLQNTTKLSLSTATMLNAVDADYHKLTDPDAIKPSAPVYAARLNSLSKNLSTAEGQVSETLKSRKILIANLEKLLATNKAAEEAEDTQLTDLGLKRAIIDTKRHEVEASIMKGFPASDADGPAASTPEPERPEIEALTPPHAD